MDTSDNNFHLYTGTDSGILKGVQFTAFGARTKNFPTSNTLSRGNEITALLWKNEKENEIYVGHRDKTVSLFDTARGRFVYRLPIGFGKGKVISIIQRNRIVLVGLESGHIGELEFCKKEEEEPLKLVDTLHSVKCMFKDRPRLGVVKEYPGHEDRFATGGCENDLAIWNFNHPKEPVFKARNLPNDTLDLRIPIWVTDLSFMQDNYTIAVASRHNCVRLYDPRAQRRPVLNIKHEESPLTSICSVPDRQGHVVIGTAHGRVTLFDLRRHKVKTRAPVVFKGINGAIKDVAAVSPSPPVAYSVSLDRYVRVHNLDTKETIHKEYLKSRLTKLVVRSSI